MPFSYFLRCHSDSGHVIPSVAEESRHLERSQGRASRFLGYARNDMGSKWGALPARVMARDGGVGGQEEGAGAAACTKPV